MLEHFIADRILQELPFEPNEEKGGLALLLGSFITSRENDSIFLLRGYAGTGKTSMTGALVRAMDKLHQPTVLLAPTGRAAKVMSAYSGYPAYTIHKYIYRQRSLGEPVFSLAQNKQEHTLFIVDEASMIADRSTDSNAFGTGRLLDDLVEYVYSSPTCRLMLIGDDAQLPPVGQIHSPALDSANLSGYGLQVMQYQLTSVARQALESGILANATYLRDQLRKAQVSTQPQWNTADNADFEIIDGQQMLELVEKAYKQVGEAETIIVTRSNRRMNLYNQGIRSRVLWKEDLLTTGDRVMVTKNNYFFAQQYEGLDFIANGDMLTIERLRHERELYGLRFADATLRSEDYQHDIDAIVCLDTLLSESPDAAYKMQQTLFSRIAEDYPEIRNRKELVKTIMANPYYNALHIKHAYAVTCHKAQGGQWKRVFVDIAMPPETIDEQYYRWLYTAITRATEQVYLVM